MILYNITIANPSYERHNIRVHVEKMIVEPNFMNFVNDKNVKKTQIIVYLHSVKVNKFLKLIWIIFFKMKNQWKLVKMATLPNINVKGYRITHY
jgi:hypothetical protein